MCLESAGVEAALECSGGAGSEPRVLRDAEVFLQGTDGGGAEESVGGEAELALDGADEVGSAATVACFCSIGS